MYYMSKFTLCLITGALLLAEATTGAKQNLPEAVSGHSTISSLMAKRIVRLHSTGRAAVTYHVATRLIQEEDVLVALQQAYASMLPEGESPEFTIKQTAQGKYAYVNRDDEKTELTEILREIQPGHVEMYIYSTGNRFFGSFEALTAIRVQPAGPNEIDWEVHVYAYPRNLLSRLVARTGVVNRFFRSKTDEITDIAVRIATFMTTQLSVRQTINSRLLLSLSS